MKNCDVGIFTYGVSVFETLFSGLPSIIISHSKESFENSLVLEKNDCFVNLGYHKELKFENICLLDLSCWHKVSKNFSLYIIPPLNEMAQELEKYEKLSEANKSYIAIDTGFIINDHITNTNHIFLGDNSPYDLNLFKKHIGNLKYSSYWFPYNGFAGDYPLCYDSISIKEKKKNFTKHVINKRTIKYRSY